MRAAVPLAGLVAACAGAAEPAPPPAPLTGAREVETTLFLIGDAGNPAPGGEPVLRALARAIGNAPGERAVVFLGDNLYPRGLPDSGAPDRREMERRLDDQLAAARATGVRGIFVPGNHDWDEQGPDGWNAIRRQERYITAHGGPSITLLPGGGCPGPAVVDLGSRIRLVVLDTQWWLHAWAKPAAPNSGCRADTDRAVADSLRADLARAGGRQVVVVAHHPLATGGEHGGYFGLADYVFPLRHVRSWLWVPLPGIGAQYPEARQRGISNQDVTGPLNVRMRVALESAMREARPLVWASGHDHNLQVIRGASARHLLVSGAGIAGHESRAVRIGGSRFARAAPGFMRLDVLRDGRVQLAVVVVDRGGGSSEAFSMWLD